MCVVPLTRASFYVVLFCVFCLLVVLVILSVPVQVIDWKDPISEIPMIDGDVKPYSLTHPHAHHAKLTAVSMPPIRHTT